MDKSRGPRLAYNKNGKLFHRVPSGGVGGECVYRYIYRPQRTPLVPLVCPLSGHSVELVGSKPVGTRPGIQSRFLFGDYICCGDVMAWQRCEWTAPTVICY